MHLRSVSLHPFHAPLKTPFVTALRRVDKLETRVVRIETDDGIVGVGEAAPTPQITDETMESIEAGFAEIAARFDAAPPDSLESALELLDESNARTPTKAAFESALFEIAAKTSGVPLWRILQRYAGVETTPMLTLHTDITVSLNDTPTTLRDVRDALARGYRHLKIKLGSHIDTEAARIETVVKTLPRDVTFRLDANQAWSAQESVAFLQRLEAQGIVCECIEQPVKADDIDGLAYVKQRCQTPVLADESVFSYAQAQRLIAQNAADMLNIKLAKTGGFREAIRIATLCREHHIPAMIGCMLEGPVAIAAAAHFAAAFGNVVKLVDLDAVALLKHPDNPTDVVFEESRIYLPSS